MILAKAPTGIDNLSLCNTVFKGVSSIHRLPENTKPHSMKPGLIYMEFDVREDLVIELISKWIQGRLIESSTDNENMDFHKYNGVMLQLIPQSVTGTSAKTDLDLVIVELFPVYIDTAKNQPSEKIRVWFHAIYTKTNTKMDLDTLMADTIKVNETLTEDESSEAD